LVNFTLDCPVKPGNDEDGGMAILRWIARSSRAMTTTYAVTLGLDPGGQNKNGIIPINKEPNQFYSGLPDQVRQ